MTRTQTRRPRGTETRRNDGRPEAEDPARNRSAPAAPHSWLAWAIGALVLVAGAAGAYYWWTKSKDDGNRGSHSQGETHDRAAVRVKVVHPKQGGIARTTTQPGVIHAYEHADLYAKASGYLRAQVVDIGDTVERGQVLAEVYDPERLQEVELAAAAVEQAKAAIEQAESLVTVAEADVEAETAVVHQRKAQVAQYTASRKYRQKQFVRYSELAVARAIDERAADEKQEDFESAKAGEEVALAAVRTAEGNLAKAVAGVVKAKADVKAARANLRAAEARETRAQILAEYLKISSPYSGIVTRRTYNRGDFIRAADSGGDTPPVLSVARTDLMRVVLYIPDREVPMVDRGDRAVVRVDALGGEEFKGKVTRFSAVELAANRSMRVEVDLPNPTGRLLEGMYGNVTILLDPAPDVLSVPSPALHEAEQGRGSLYVVRDGKARRVNVRVGKDDGLVAEILSGLNGSERVIVSYSGSIEDGEDVEVFPATLAEARREGRESP